MPQYFSVKNFQEFQHYKDRSPPWIKFYNNTLDDYELARLPDASKAHLYAIWLLASRTDNKIPYDSKWVAAKINATCPVDLEALVKSGFIITEQDCSDMLADSKQTACLERETEGETEVEKKLCAFDDFWLQCPVKKSKKKAKALYEGVIKRGEATHAVLLEGIMKYAMSDEVQRGYAKHPTTWLNGGCWDDEPTPARKQQSAVMEAVRGLQS